MPRLMVGSRRRLLRTAAWWWRSLLVVGGVVATTSSAAAAAAPVSTQSELQRVQNLDYLDVPALQYYLNSTTTEPYDVAILFYIQSSPNCHALAPVWEQISRIVQAGTVTSNLIVGLFDCDVDRAHAELCHAVGVKKYPTLAFVSLAGNRHRLSRKSPHHVTLYAADLQQYGQAVLDWVVTLSALAQWHRAGWGRRLRNAIMGRSNRRSSAPEPLPLGVPQAVQNEVELQTMKETFSDTVALARRGNNFVDCLLFPVSVPGAPTVNETDNHSNKVYTDVYAYLHEYESWSAPSSSRPDTLLKTCTTEVSLDYCQRVSTAYMESWIAEWPPQKSITETDFAVFEKELQQYLNATEPFCQVMDECALADFALTKCQPQTCPFVDRVACRYLTACLTEALQQEYAEALDALSPQSGPSSNKKSKKEKAKTSTGFSWGM